MHKHALLLLAVLSVPALHAAAIPEYSYEVVHVYPHDRTAFTEGLFFLNNYLYEATGLEGRSSVRKVEIATGKVVQQQSLPEGFFGEGIVAIKNKLIQLTYTTEKGFIYNLKTLRPEGEFQYPGQGWALTYDGQQIIMDDGTPQIRFWDPDTLHEIRRVTVRANGIPLQYINELEWVKGEIYANVWHTDRIARIDPQTGNVKGWIDLSGLLPASDLASGQEATEQVLNGIAYDPANDRLFVTGKYWPKLFEIKIHPKR